MKIKKNRQSFSSRLARVAIKEKSTTDNSSVVDLKKLQKLVQQINYLEEQIANCNV
jgi:hypothetical protein